jgi:phosphatidylglycerol:prolipoprotein diacylglycerol transferase
MMLSKNIVSFPGIGIDNFELDNVAFTIGESFKVYWYGVIITLGIVLAFIYASFRAKYEKIKVDDLIDVALWTVILGVIGARLYYVLTTLENYIPEPFNLWQFFKNIFNLRQGGLAIYGGIICGILGIVISTKIKKMNTIKLMDIAGPGVMIAQSLGRWGNFFNGEAFGGLVSEGHPLYFIRMGLISDNTLGDFGTKDMVYVHPTFLYESLWNLTGFILINIFYKKKKFNGQVACMYLSWYGFGRFFIEGLRTDSLYVGPFRISQVVGILCFIVFGGLLVAGLIYSKKLEEKENKSVFDGLFIPNLIEKPVFFIKNIKDQQETDIAVAVDENRTAEKTEDDENGTDN